MNDSLTQEELKKAKEAGTRFYTSQEENELSYLKEGLACTDKERFRFYATLYGFRD